MEGVVYLAISLMLFLLVVMFRPYRTPIAIPCEYRMNSVRRPDQRGSVVLDVCGTGMIILLVSFLKWHGHGGRAPCYCCQTLLVETTVTFALTVSVLPLVNELLFTVSVPPVQVIVSTSPAYSTSLAERI